MSSITRNNFSIHSNSKGNLLKTEYQKGGIVYFVKSGRLQVRDFPEKWGIEPVIDKTVDLVYTKYMKARIDYEGVQWIEQFMFHKDAFREILLNAIIHKDYSSCNPI